MLYNYPVDATEPRPFGARAPQTAFDSQARSPPRGAA